MTATIKEVLRHWGYYQEHAFVALVQPIPLDEAPARDNHPLARAQQYARGNKAAHVPVERDGSSRRLLLGAAAGLVDGRGGHRPVAKSFVDHIPCTETRSGTSAPPAAAAIAGGSPDEYRWIDRALSAMHRQNMVRAMVVWEEFTGRGSQAARAAVVSKRAGVPLTKWQYRKELEKGMAFLEARRS